jgi:hypothetical protein
LVDFEADENTQFMVIFKEMKSVLTLQAGTIGYSAQMYDGVPKGLSVKIIGFRVKDGVTQTFEHECKTEDVGSMKINFKVSKLKELRALLGAV